MQTHRVHSTARIGAVRIQDKAGRQVATILEIWPGFLGRLPNEPSFDARATGCPECGCAAGGHYLGCYSRRDR